MRVAINGLGRIGRTFFRSALRSRDINVTAINDPAGLETVAHLIKYDSSHGTFEGEVRTEGDLLYVNGAPIRVFEAATAPEALPWREEKIDLVLESSGRFTARAKAAGHLAAGAGRVVISAPASEADITIVMGVNDALYQPDRHRIVSNASCTTNCLAPLLKVLDERFGIRQAVLTTVHPYTNNQQLHDVPHADLRRGRAAALSMVPTTTTAIQAVLQVMPELKGKIDGMAIRVPVANVANIDLVAMLGRETTAAEVNRAYREAALGALKGVLDVSEDQLVSNDFRGNTFSSIVDAPCTQVIGGDMVKVLSWYDNEAGYSQRLVDLIRLIEAKG